MGLRRQSELRHKGRSDHHFRISSSVPRPYTACLWLPRQTNYPFASPFNLRPSKMWFESRSSLLQLDPQRQPSRTSGRFDETRSQVASRLQQNESEDSHYPAHGSTHPADVEQVCFFPETDTNVSATASCIAVIRCLASRFSRSLALADHPFPPPRRSPSVLGYPNAAAAENRKYLPLSGLQC